jgi:hypothetical protein
MPRSKKISLETERVVSLSAHVAISSKVTACAKIDSILAKGGESFSEEKLPPQRFYNASGSIVDQGLNNNYEIDKKQLTFEDLGLRTQERDLELGINLPAGARALKNTLERLFFEKSSKSGLGNYKPTVALLFGVEHTAPRYLTSHQELAREHTGKTKPSGSDILEVRRNLKVLSEKTHMFTMRGAKDKSGNRPVLVDHARIIINLVEGYEEVTEAEDATLTRNSPTIATLKKGKILLTGNPIFALDIDRKYVPKPTDINERIRDASGSNKPSEAISRFSDYLHRQLTDPVTKATGRHEIGEDKLIYALGLDKYQKEGRKKKVREGIEGAIKTCSHARLPLLLEVSKSWDKSGKPKYIFTLNRHFPNPPAMPLDRDGTPVY